MKSVGIACLKSRSSSLRLFQPRQTASQRSRDHLSSSFSQSEIRIFINASGSLHRSRIYIWSDFIPTACTHVHVHRWDFAGVSILSSWRVEAIGLVRASSGFNLGQKNPCVWLSFVCRIVHRPLALSGHTVQTRGQLFVSP